MYVKVLDNITATLKRGKGGGRSSLFSPYGKVPHLILSKIVDPENLDPRNLSEKLHGLEQIQYHGVAVASRMKNS